MTAHLLETVGKLAGIGGLSLGVFLILFREVIRKSIFPSLDAQRAYSLIRQFLYLTFLIAALGIAAWAYIEHQKQLGSKPDIHQTGSINVAGVVGNVVISVPDLPQPLTVALEKELNGRRLDLADAKREAESYRTKYEELRARLDAIGIDADAEKKAEQYLSDGRLDKAAAVLKSILPDAEQEVQKAADAHYQLATLYTLKFDLSAALPHYKQAYSYRPDNLRYGIDYANTLLDQDQLSKAKDIFEQLIKNADQSQAPAGFGSDLAHAMASLGAIYFKLEEFDKAEAIFVRAITRFKNLVPKYPEDARRALAVEYNALGLLYDHIKESTKAVDAYNVAQKYLKLMRDPDKEMGAVIQNNLGNLYAKAGKSASASAAYESALKQFRNDTVFMGDKGLYNQAAVLHDLALLHSNTGAHEEAEKEYKQEIDLLRTLVKHDPAAYRLGLANSLENLSIFYFARKEYSRSQELTREVVSLRRQLASSDPEAHSGQLAASLNQQGYVYKESRQYSDAEAAFAESLALNKKLASNRPDTYELEIASVTESQGELYVDMGRLDVARKKFMDALNIFYSLSKKHYSLCEPCLGQTLQNLGMLEAKIGHFDEAERDFKSALAIRKRLTKSEPGNTRFSRDLADTISSLAGLAEREHSFSKIRALGRDGMSEN